MVETINWTIATEEAEPSVHLNCYIAQGMADAIAFATRAEIVSQEVAEQVVAIRLATMDEERVFLCVFDHFQACMPKALSWTQALELALPRGAA